MFVVMLYAAFVVSSDSDDASEKYFSIHYGDINEEEHEEEYED